MYFFKQPEDESRSGASQTGRAEKRCIPIAQKRINRTTSKDLG